MNYLITYIICLIGLIGLDYVWLGIIMQSHIQRRLGPLMRDQILLRPALAFYVLYTVAIIVFAVRPGLVSQSRLTATGYGALLGFTAYMTYDLTNWSTLRSRPVSMALPDILWGTVVTAIVAVIGYFVMIYFTN